MSNYGEDAQFEDLSPTDYNDLIVELNDNSKWKILSLYLVETFDLPRRELIYDIERKGNMPNAECSCAELLLMELRTGACTIATLCHWLQECGLLYALYILVGEVEQRITEQPYPKKDAKSYEAAIGDEISITCMAEGLPPPRYLWFHGNVEKPDQTSSTLCLHITSPDQEGEYMCRVSQYDRRGELIREQYSNCAPLEIKPTPVEIKEQTTFSKVKLGESLVLTCKATGHPIPKYQWYKNHEELEGQKSDTLRIDKFQREDKGEYYCRVSNEVSDKTTAKIEVKVDFPRQKASAKVALLIANDDYQYKEKLLTPENDAALLANRLRSIGFHVTCWKNLTLEETRHAVEIFCGSLKPDAYGLFYYVGHGFNMHGGHMMPVDVSDKFLAKDTFSQAQLLSYFNEKKPALLVCILDMCLTLPPRESNPDIYKEIPEICEFKCNNNLILAYSTCSHNFSYERKGAENGVYATHLCNHITSNKPAHDVFIDIGHSVIESTTHKTKDQKPMLTTVTTEPYRYLTDEVISKSSGLPSQYNLDVTESTTFASKRVKIKFRKCDVSARVTVNPLKTPFMNIIELTTTGLEEWDVGFHNSPDNPVKLYTNGKNCHIYNPQRVTEGVANQGSLMIEIGKDGIVHDSKRFSYMKHVPEILRAL